MELLWYSVDSMGSVTDTAPNTTELKLNPTVLKQPASIDIVQTTTPGEYEIKLQAGLPIVFQTAQGQMSFSADADSKLAIYPDVKSLQSALAQSVDFPKQVAVDTLSKPNARFALLRWSYDASANATGSIALAPGASAGLSSDGGRKALFALVREVPSGPAPIDTLADLIQSWRMPRQIRTPDDIRPGTWLIAETNASFNLTASAKYGYDMTWVRQMTTGVLKGDIGLRLQAGLEAQVGFHASGQYALILSRTDQPQIRLQLYRLATCGWGASLQGGVTIAPNENYLPPSPDDLIKGMLGIHPTQILQGLCEVEQWIQPDQPLFGPLANLDPKVAADIVRAITSVADLTTGFEVAKAVLRSIVPACPLDPVLAEINRRLDLNQLAQAVQSGDLSKVDPWLAGRLQEFLGNTQPNLQSLKDLSLQLQKLASLKDALYSKSLAALKRQYEFAFTASYQSASTDTALVDLTFDFSKDAKTAAQALATALDGQFDRLFESQNGCLTINQGVLTRGIQRQSSVELALPFVDNTEIHITNALASMNVVDQADGRVVVYNCTGTDLLEVKNQLQSSLSIGLVAPNNSGIIAHNQSSAACSYKLPMAIKQLTRAGLQARFTPELQEYFPQLNGKLDQWIDTLIGSGSDRIGDTLLTLEVSLPPEYVTAWLKAPPAKNGPIYKSMSLSLQSKFREFLLRQYFASSDRYGDVAEGSPVFDLLVFASTPCMSAPPHSGDIYWNYEDDNFRRAMLSHPATITKLHERLDGIRTILSADRRQDLLSYYSDNQGPWMIASAQASAAMEFLFRTEARMIEQARSTALSLAEFQTTKASSAVAARKALADFGMQAATAFNSDLKTYATGLTLLPLGSLLFADAARVFDPALKPPAQAMLSLVVAKNGPFPPANFPQHAPLNPRDILLESHLVPGS